jgi:formamidopyrimidine-DNA glycosylase
MPELPEVETIVRDLAAKLKGSKIKSFKLLYKKAIKVSPSVWRRRVVGQKISKVWRRGKQLIFDLGSGEHIVIHLKMTGQLIWKHKRQVVAGGHPIVGVGQELPNKFTRAIFYFSDGSELFFNDVRKFGWLKLVSADGLDKEFGRLGLEPLSSQLTGRKLQALFKAKSRSKIKAALMDQTKVAGIGNIYADEALWQARIRPARRVAKIKSSEWQTLATAIKKVLRLSIRHRGTSFSDYRDAQGQPGNFLNKLKVYGRGGKPCPRCGRPITKTRLGGRGTHYCEHCQK